MEAVTTVPSPVRSVLIDVITDIVLDRADAKIPRKIPVVNTSDQVLTSRDEVDQEFEVAPMVTETNVVAEGPEESTLPRVDHDLPTRSSDKRGKIHVTEPRYEMGFVYDKDSAFKDPNLAYALAYSLQTPGDKEIMDQLMTLN